MSDARRLFLLTFCVVALLTKTDPDSALVMSRLGTVESIVDRHTYALDDSIFIGTIDKVQKDGHFYSHQPPVLSTITAPVYWLLHLPGTRFNNRGRFVMTYAFALLTNGLALVATVMLFARVLGVMHVVAPWRDVLAVMLVFGTWLLPFGLVPNNHGISGLLLAGLISLLIDYQREGPTNTRLALIGGVLGLLVAIEVLPIVSFLPLTIILFAARRDLNGSAWAAFAGALALPLVLHAIINVQITGDLIPAGFHTELFRYEGSVFDDTSLSGTLKYHSMGEAGRYAWASLFANKGFFTFAPLCLLGVAAGLIEWRWWRTHLPSVHTIVLSGIALSLAVALLTTNNYGGEAVGFRHAAFLGPAFIVLLLPWLIDARPMRAFVLAIAALSVASMLAFAVRQPWSVLTLSHPTIGSTGQYVPLIWKIVHGTIFKP